MEGVGFFNKKQKKTSGENQKKNKRVWVMMMI